jgi:hypothetical protein
LRRGSGHILLIPTAGGAAGGPVVQRQAIVGNGLGHGQQSLGLGLGKARAAQRVQPQGRHALCIGIGVQRRHAPSCASGSPASAISLRRSETATATVICWPVMAQVSASKGVGEPGTCRPAWREQRAQLGVVAMRQLQLAGRVDQPQHAFHHRLQRSPVCRGRPACAHASWPAPVRSAIAAAARRGCAAT